MFERSDLRSVAVLAVPAGTVIRSVTVVPTESVDSDVGGNRFRIGWMGILDAEAETVAGIVQRDRDCHRHVSLAEVRDQDRFIQARHPDVTVIVDGSVQTGAEGVVS